jgi:hypothetical protein
MSLEVEFGNMSRTGGTFATLARRSGFSEAECALAAEHDSSRGSSVWRNFEGGAPEPSPPPTGAAR